MTETLGLPPALIVFAVAMVPVLELRASLPLGVYGYDMPLVQAAAWSVIGNLVPMPLVLAALPTAERWVRRWAWAARAMDRLFARTRRRSSKLVERFEEAGLALFVAVPLPGTGAWTGALVAHLFALPRGASLATLAVGVVGAALIVASLIAAGNLVFLP